ncbi:hypothetical protein C8R44DRAFT_654912, partial [Mycena epipterygia]
NSVVYLEFVPGGFKIGDIVELQISFVTIPAAMNRVKATIRLQAVTLLSNKYSKAST